MIEFNLWRESFIFGIVYFFVIAIPCVLTLLMGWKVIYQLGHYPTKTPIILMRTLWPFVGLVVVTFGMLLGFYLLFV